jgi:DNA-directed RNA polymerase subunit alpha
MNPGPVYINFANKYGSFKTEFLIKRGRGYELGPVVAPYELGPLVSGASETGELSEFLATGAVYMPVKAVTFSVEPIVGVYWDNVTSEESERLLLEVSTNGSITPAEAVNAAIDTIRDFLKMLKDRFVPTTIENSQNSQLEEFFS